MRLSYRRIDGTKDRYGYIDLAIDANPNIHIYKYFLFRSSILSIIITFLPMVSKYKDLFREMLAPYDTNEEKEIWDTKRST